MKVFSCAAIVCGLISVCLTVGCSDGLPERVHVSGKVTVDGKPVNSGSIRFAPSAGGRVAIGEIADDGSFTMTTYKRADGCVPGEHKVTVQLFENVGPTTRRWLLPKKYAMPATSPLKISVTEPTDSLQIKLSWDGAPGPFVENF